MHRIKAAVIPAVAVLIILFSLTLVSCGDGDGQSDRTSPVIGTWEMTAISVNGRELDAAAYMKAAHVNQVPTLTFEKNGKVTLETDSHSGRGSWREEGIRYTVNYIRNEKETEVPVRIEDSVMTMEQDGYLLTYERK